MPHDIIDNRTRELAPEINAFLADSIRAHFAVGYFFLSGFEAIAAHIPHLDPLRLLIGNVTNRQTVEPSVCVWNLPHELVAQQPGPRRWGQGQPAAAAGGGVAAGEEGGVGLRPDRFEKHMFEEALDEISDRDWEEAIAAHLAWGETWHGDLPADVFFGVWANLVGQAKPLVITVQLGTPEPVVTVPPDSPLTIEDNRLFKA